MQIDERIENAMNKNGRLNNDGISLGEMKCNLEQEMNRK